MTFHHLALALSLSSAVLISGCTSQDLAPLERGTQTPLRHTLKELRDRHVVKQQEDYSCGAAALATLLVYYYGDPTNEREILHQLEQGLSADEKKKKEVRGFSLLDLKRVAEERGYRAAGFKLKMSQLSQVAVPVLVFVEPLGYKHFAVYRGFDRGRVYIADPSRGNLRMTLGRFLSEWSGIVLVLGRKGDEDLKEFPLALPYPIDSQPEVTRFGAQLDFNTVLPLLPQRSP